MENVLFVIHLILALGLIVVVLMQRSEGGGLGMGGGGGGAMTAGRAQATALGKLTWILGIAFIATSISLTIIAAQKSAGASVIDQLGVTPPSAEDSADPVLPPLGDLLPPTAGDDSPLVPSID